MLKRLLADLMGRRRDAAAKAASGEPAVHDPYARAEALVRERRIDEARAALRAEPAARPDDARALHLAAEFLRLEAKYADAVPLYRRALLADPRRTDAWAGLGDCHARMGDTEQAYITYRTALSLEPDRADVHNELGMIGLALGNLSAAAESFDQAVNIDTGNAEAWNNLGLVAASRGRFEEARRRFHRAVHLRPAFYTALCNLGLACRDLGRLGEAEEALCRATQAEPAKPAAWLNLAAVMQDAGRLGEARGVLDSAAAAAPGDVGVLVATGTLMMRLGEVDAAARALGEALRAAPEDAEANLAQAHLDLLRGRYAEGWDRYDARLRASQSPRLRFPYPEWDGSDPGGRTILVYAEQGVGDTILFASCLGDLAGRAGACRVYCEDRLWPLLQRSIPGIERHEPSREPGPDAYVAIGSLPRLYRRSERDFPVRDAYLRADPDAVARVRAALPAARGALRVGIAWRGGLASTGRAVRSLDLAQLRPLLDAPGIDWVCLQHGEVGAELDAFERASGIRIHRVAEAPASLDALAAAICAVDVVVTVCSSVVHLAGALGRKAWVLTPHAPAWRYRLEGEGMPWYPSVRLYRQAVRGDWTPVLQAVRRDLAAAGSAP